MRTMIVTLMMLMLPLANAASADEEWLSSSPCDPTTMAGCVTVLCTDADEAGERLCIARLEATPDAPFEVTFGSDLLQDGAGGAEVGLPFVGVPCSVDPNGGIIDIGSDGTTRADLCAQPELGDLTAGEAGRVCRRAAVEAGASGYGYVRGFAQCGSSVATSCTAYVWGYTATCRNVDYGYGSNYWYCAARVSGNVAWYVRCSFTFW